MAFEDLYLRIGTSDSIKIRKDGRY
jgi:hypothetical protein